MFLYKCKRQCCGFYGTYGLCSVRQKLWLYAAGPYAASFLFP